MLKRKYIAGSALALVGILALVSCEKTFDNKVALQSDLSNETTVQVIVATVNASRNHVWVDGNRATGAALSSGSIFPTTGYGFSVDGGLRAFLVQDTLVTTTQLPLSFAENMQVAKHQTIFLYDTITSPKQKTVVDDIVVPTDTTARLRFAHFAFDPSMQPPAVDIYSAVRQQNIFTNVPYTGVTDFIPIASGRNDTLYIRPAGTSTNLQTVSSSGVWSDMRLILNPTIRRSYTMVFRGSFRTTLTSNSHVRTLSLYVTR